MLLQSCVFKKGDPMVTFRKLVNKDELDSFIDGFELHVKVKLPFSYVETGLAIGAFRNSKMVGGFMIQSGPHLRVPGFIPQNTKSNHKLFKNNTYNDLAEVNGVWLNIRSKKTSLKFWYKIRTELLKSRKKYIITGVNASNIGLKCMYENLGLLKKNIYSGEVRTESGELVFNNYIIGVSSLFRLRLMPISKGPYILKKFVFNSKKKQKTRKQLVNLLSN